jgi:hypothetical protein
MKQVVSRAYLILLILWPWRWRRYIPPTCRLTFNGLHGVMSQNSSLNLTFNCRFTAIPLWMKITLTLLAYLPFSFSTVRLWIYSASCFFTKLSLALNVLTISEQRIETDMEGKCHSIIWDTIPTFASRDWEKQRKLAVTFAVLRPRAEPSTFRMQVWSFAAGFTVEVLTGVTVKGSVFWVTTSCSLEKVNWRFGGTCKSVFCLLHADFLFGVLYEHEYVFLRKVCWLSQDYTALYSRSWKSSGMTYFYASL